MDRQIVYPGQIPLETDLLNTNKYTMIAVAKLAAAMLGTATVVNGLACVPTGPASLQVVVNPGEMYSLQNVDGTAYSSIAADTTHSILKQGISMDAVTLSCPAPVTAGQSVNYLIQATYQDSDTGLVTLPYYNASNPSQAWSGPNNSGAQQATARKGGVNITVKAGVAATTGSQTTPAPDAGYTGLWVVTVANGQTTITAGNISQAAGAPFLTETLTQKISAATLTQLKGVQRFTSSGSFTVPAGVTQIFVSGCAGGGGGGGGAGNNAVASSAGGGGGGGAGQSTIRQPFTVTPGASISITIGAAGTAGNGGAAGVNSGATGGSGGNTIVGSLITLTGGAGGTGGASGPGSGGPGGTGFPTGSYGLDGLIGAGGAGASSPFGGGGGLGRGATSAAAPGGTAGVSFGAGGGGGGATYAALSAAGAAGGAGAPGFVAIEW